MSCNDIDFCNLTIFPALVEPYLRLGFSSIVAKVVASPSEQPISLAPPLGSEVNSCSLPECVDVAAAAAAAAAAIVVVVTLSSLQLARKMKITFHRTCCCWLKEDELLCRILTHSFAIIIVINSFV
uniref:Uncharacterized protein n=1 Tax=Glossina austeni TaxID=7395 RepID=A0A1A9VTP6_GLOAU